MPKFDSTRFIKASTPKLGGSLNLQDRIIGQNKRKQKLTESPGTNAAKLGGTSVEGGMEKLGGKGGSNTSYAQDTAPFKHEMGKFNIGVGGPGFDQINMPWKNK